MKTFSRHLVGICVLLSASLAPLEIAAAPAFTWVSRANTPPRKVVIGSALANLSGSVEARLNAAVQLLDTAARDAGGEPGRGLDLMVFPEFALCRETGKSAAERAVPLEGPVLETLGAAARRHRTWIVIPMTLQEGSEVSNAAVLLDRAGKVAGIFRKVNPVADDAGVLEDGVTPGASYPVFECDFGKLGILICWDMGYESGWDALAAGGAEIVALPSASPQTLQPMAQALRHRYYVVTSAPRDNSTLYDPVGRTIGQTTTAPGVVVREIDLAFAILHWTETLREGRALTEKYGAQIGGSYSTREDTGLFWSNDPQASIGEMIRTLGLREMPAEIERMEKAARARRPMPR